MTGKTLLNSGKNLKETEATRESLWT